MEVPIRPLLEENPGAFGPEDIQAIVAAFDALLKDFGLTDRSPPR